MLPRFHFLYSLTIALIWAGFWWGTGAVHSDWSNAIPQLDQVNLQQVQSANQSSLFQSWKNFHDAPYSSAEGYYNRASVVHTTIKNAMDTIPTLSLPLFWKKRNAYFQLLTGNCDYNEMATAAIKSKWLISDSTDQKFATLFRSNPEAALNSFKLKLAIGEYTTVCYLSSRMCIADIKFDKYTPVNLEKNAAVVHEKIQIPIVLPDFRGNYRWFSSPGFPPVKNDVIDTTLIFNSTGVQRMPFLLRYEDMETGIIHEVHDTLSFRIYAR